MNESIGPDKHRVLVIDDHPIVRLGIRQMLEMQPDLELCGEAATADKGLELAQRERPDLAIVDLSLVQGTSMELIRKLREAAKGVSVLVISMHDEMLFAERALCAGARGYIMKDVAIDGLIEAMRQVLSGQVYVSSKVSQSLLERLGQEDGAAKGSLEQLTDREIEVFEMVGRGISTAKIAEQLAVSIKTVETYRANIRNKLNLKNATELVRFASAWTAKL